MRHALTATLAGLLLLSAAPAEARFGKRSKDSASEKKKDRDDDGDEGEGERKGRRTHAASAPGTVQHVAHVHDDGCGHAYHRSAADVSVGLFLHALLDADVHATAHGGPRGEVRGEARPSQELHLRAGGDLAFLTGPTAEGGGAALTGDVRIEGARWGFGMQATGLALPTDDGTVGWDRISLFQAHVTFAPITLERLRVRLEGGLATASAPDVTFVGPSIGASMEACLVGPLDLEVRTAVVPYPYQAIDASAGLALRLGALTVRGGWRGLVLNDQGWVDGVTNEDTLAGPQVGLAVTF